MLHQHEPHARIERQMREQLGERNEPARRGPTPTIRNDEPLLGSPLFLTGLFAGF
jgi:hypothetical protein